MTVFEIQDRTSEPIRRLELVRGGANAEVLEWLAARLGWEDRLARLERIDRRLAC